VPVYNVSIPVMQRDFWLIGLDISKPTRAALHRGEHFVIVPEGLSERYPCATTVGGVDKPHVV